MKKEIKCKVKRLLVGYFFLFLIIFFLHICSSKKKEGRKLVAFEWKYRLKRESILTIRENVEGDEKDAEKRNKQRKRNEI